jgi:hypothetical protein
MRLALLLFLLAAAAGSAAPEERLDGAQESPRELADPPSPTPLENATRRAMERGLAYLARRQAETADGSFPRGSADETEKWAPVGVTALGALAFLAGGNSPRRGPYGREVEAAIDYLVSKADLTPSSPTYGYIHTQGDKHSQTHGHGFATLALAQAYGMSPQSEKLRAVLVAAVELIESSQGSEGGWYYDPHVSASHEGSITICYVQALRASRNVGIRVDHEVVQRAEDYVLRLQNDDGSFRYGLNEEHTSVALTAAGIATLNAAGRYDTGAIRSGVDSIWTGLETRDPRDVRFPFYERLYLAQAFWQLNDPRDFERWFARVSKRIVTSQEPDGSWTDRQYGNCYATAVCCLVLAVPEGVLPIFQR